MYNQMTIILYPDCDFKLLMHSNYIKRDTNPYLGNSHPSIINLHSRSKHEIEVQPGHARSQNSTAANPQSGTGQFPQGPSKDIQ
jgi:hypothetical protein